MQPQALLVALGINKKSGAQKAALISLAALKKAYKDYIRDNNTENAFPSWKDDQAAMMKILGKKPTDKLIKQIRSEMAPKAWTERGRRKRA